MSAEIVEVVFTGAHRIPREIVEIAGRVILPELNPSITKDRAPGVEPIARVTLGPSWDDSAVQYFGSADRHTTALVRQIRGIWNRQGRPEPEQKVLTLRVAIRDARHPAVVEVTDRSGEVLANVASYFSTDVAVLQALWSARGEGHGAIRDLVGELVESFETGRKHSEALGELCEDDGTGCCGVCGAELSVCETCGRRAYHAPDCAENDANAQVRS